MLVYVSALAVLSRYPMHVCFEPVEILLHAVDVGETGDVVRFDLCEGLGELVFPAVLLDEVGEFLYYRRILCVCHSMILIKREIL